MSRFSLSRLLAVFGFTLVVAVGFALESRSQALKSHNGIPAPEFQGVTQWINSEPLTMAKLRGKIVVVHFWTNGCYNCVNNYPHYRSWQERYAGKDVAIIGIHTPETPGEHDVERIKVQAAKHGLKFPIAVDNDGSNWNAWDNRSWPTVYVIDRRGIVRFTWEGELSFKGAAGEETVRKLIDELLLERG
jgi:peroxiredoxin